MGNQWAARIGAAAWKGRVQQRTHTVVGASGRAGGTALTESAHVCSHVKHSALETSLGANRCRVPLQYSARTPRKQRQATLLHETRTV